ncbi:MAG: hypothetical protein RR636_06925 [Clostridium sp.]|uniref:hypothetical protein n=1 Tax=Clostridium sp. TaxID=1506 RepID=UPI00304AC3B0
MTGYNINMFQKVKEAEAKETNTGINDNRKSSSNWKLSESLKVTAISGIIITGGFLLLILFS